MAREYMADLESPSQHFLFRINHPFNKSKHFLMVFRYGNGKDEKAKVGILSIYL